MKNKPFKYISSVAVLTMLMQTTPVLASPVTQGQIQTTQNEINQLDTQILQLDNQISIAMGKIQTMNEDIKAQQEKIAKTKVEIEEAEKSFEAHKKIYNERLRSLQEQGEKQLITYIGIILSSESLSDFIHRATAISTIIESDTDLMNSLQMKQQELADAKEKLDNQLKELKNKQNELASEQRKLEEDKKKIQQQLTDSKSRLQNQKDQFAEQQAQLQAQLQARQAQQTQLALATKAKQPILDVSQLTYSSDKAKTVIANAQKYLGVPYAWGGTSPSGFDCSGLTQYVFRSVGVQLPRVSHDQQNFGTRISPRDVQPGDLVFMGYPAYHVGIYIGGGKWLHAPQTGDVVKIANYNPAYFTTASRVLR